MIDFSVEVYSVDFAPEVKHKLNSALDAMFSALKRRAVETAPKRTGKLRSSISLKREGMLSGTLTYGAPYAGFLVHGTGLYGPHKKLIRIKPRHKKALYWRGARHPVRGVLQKGIKPMDFIKRALDKTALVQAFERGFGNEG
jgi:hypothetical protein